MRVIRRVLASIALVLAMAPPAFAADDAALAEIREQLKALAGRVDRLEQENVTLKEQNEQLRNESEYLRAQTRGLRKEGAELLAETSKVKGADWASRVALKGDFRYRHEQISDESLNAQGVAAADRERDRVRARVSVEARPVSGLTVGIGMATTEGGDPRSSNQSLDEVFSRKSFDLDLAYFDWRFAQWGNLIGGKMKQPFMKPGQSVFWDGDVNPEGLAAGFASGSLFGTVYNYWLDEVSGPETSVTADIMLRGAQVGTRLPIGAANLVLAGHYYDLSAAQGRSPFYNNNANGNTLAGGRLVYDYQVVNLSAELNTLLGQRPLQFWADAARNLDADDFDTAWSAGATYGKASDYRTWEFGVSYQLVEKDALFAQLVDSDFAGGNTDAQGWILRAGYAPLKNLVLNATWFANDRNVDVSNSAGQSEVAYDRLQLDFNVKF